MDSLRPAHSAIEAVGLSVSVDDAFLAASLRYFDSHGGFATAVREAVGRPLPEPLRAIRAELATNPKVTLVWRSPTETLLLCKDAQAFVQLERRLAAAADGCMVDQTGGIRVVRVRGPKTDDLLARLGENCVAPGMGEARTGRLAELQVTALRIEAGEVLLLVDRVYAEHLLEWIAVTAGDL